MSRDLEPRTLERDGERPDPARGGRQTDDPRDGTRTDPRDVLARAIDLPHGPERERVEYRGRTYELRGSEVRTLAGAGAFRVVPATDLRDGAGRPLDARSRELSQLRQQRLVRIVAPSPKAERTALVTLTPRGQRLLEAYRSPGSRQTFYAGPGRAQDLEHDAQIYRAYLRAADRLNHDGSQVVRVVLEVELKREYQRFLQAENKGRSDSDGRPTRDHEEIRRWAEDHELAMFDGRVHFPDVRLEYERVDGRRGIEDVEVTTVHYRGAHAAAKAQAGFTRFRGASARVGGRPFDPRVAEEVL